MAPALQEFINGGMERVCMVLEYLPPHDLLAVSRVSKRLRNVILYSPTLHCVLANGPTRHYSDRLPRDWKLWDLRGNDLPFKQMGCTWSALYSDKKAYVLDFCDTQHRTFIDGTEDELRIVAHWDSKPDGLHFSSSHREFDHRFPTLQGIAAIMRPLDNVHLSDPPLPVFLECHVPVPPVEHDPVTGSPLIHSIESSDALSNQERVHYGGAVVELGTCTVGDIIKFAIALERSPPKEWDMNTKPITGVWRPREEYPHLMDEEDFRAAVALTWDRVIAWEAF